MVKLRVLLKSRVIGTRNYRDHILHPRTNTGKWLRIKDEAPRAESAEKLALDNGTEREETEPPLALHINSFDFSAAVGQAPEACCLPSSLSSSSQRYNVVTHIMLIDMQLCLSNANVSDALVIWNKR